MNKAKTFKLAAVMTLLQMVTGLGALLLLTTI
jgi:hypothetical protein